MNLVTYLCPNLGLNYVSKRVREECHTVYPKKYAHGFCFAVLCCGYTLTDFPISIRLTSLALWQSNDCPSASKATLMNMEKYFMWIHYERLHNHNKAKHNKTVCIFLGIYCICYQHGCNVSQLTQFAHDKYHIPTTHHVDTYLYPIICRHLDRTTWIWIWWSNPNLCWFLHGVGHMP